MILRGRECIFGRDTVGNAKESRLQRKLSMCVRGHGSARYAMEFE